MCFTGIITPDLLNAMIAFEMLSEHLPEAAFTTSPKLKEGELREIVTDVHRTVKALYEGKKTALLVLHVSVKN